MEEKQFLFDLTKERLNRLYKELNMSDDDFIDWINKEFNWNYEKNEADTIKVGFTKGILNALLYLLND